MANILPVPTPKDIALFFGDRDAKVIETATKAAGTLSNKTIDSTNVIAGAAMTAASIAAAKMATVPGFVVKFMQLGSTITTTALAGLAVNDICVTLTPGVGGVAALSVALCTVANTLPSDPADTDWVLVLRAAV